MDYCPRCRKGVLEYDRDQYGKYAHCRSCGYYIDEPNPAKVGNNNGLRPEGNKYPGIFAVSGEPHETAS